MGRIRSIRSGRGLPTSSPSANPVGGIGGILATAGSSQRKLLPLTLTAIGVVYGDIGTSPLYAMRECFFGSHSVPPTHENVLGVLSLIIYSLLLVISIKYIAIVMRADNQGEGGILALTALLPSGSANGARWSTFVLMGIFGAALLYGDGMITPAITVLGAVEGLKVATPLFEAVRRSDHRRHSRWRFCDSASWHASSWWLFGPIMVGWFIAIAVLGISWLCENQSCSQPSIRATPSRSSLSTGGMGSPFLGPCSSSSREERPCTPTWDISENIHPGRVVCPGAAALLLNYFGQGALLLSNPKAAEQPFFLLAPAMGAVPTRRPCDRGGDHRVAGADLWCVLADTTSDTTRILPAIGYRAYVAARDRAGVRAAGELGPDAQHDCDRHRFRIINRIGRRLWHCRDTDHGDYGDTPVRRREGAMALARRRSRCRTGVFLTVDLAFFGANALKITHGGWLPLVIGALLFTLMTTWKTGRRIVAQRLTARAVPLEISWHESPKADRPGCPVRRSS